MSEHHDARWTTLAVATFPEILRNNAASLTACYADLDPREAEAIANRLREAADALVSAESRVLALQAERDKAEKDAERWKARAMRAANMSGSSSGVYFAIHSSDAEFDRALLKERGK